MMIPDIVTPSTMSLLLVVFVLLVSLQHDTTTNFLANAACLPEDLAPNFTAQVESAELVAHVKLIPNETTELLCGIEVFDEDTTTYVIEDEFPSYDIIEIFKGRELVGDNNVLTMVWWTDTGYRVNLPTWFTDDPTGLLAIMDGRRLCQNETDLWPYPDNYTWPIPFKAGECSYGNRPWSLVSDEDREYLESLVDISPGEEGPPTTEPSMSPTTFELGFVSSSSPTTVELGIGSSSAPTIDEEGLVFTSSVSPTISNAPVSTQDSPLTGSAASKSGSNSSAGTSSLRFFLLVLATVASTVLVAFMT